MNPLWEILVPTVSNDGKPFRTRYHRVWDAKVRKITGGMTIFKPTTKGEWIGPDGKLFIDRTIPVRVCCTEAEIKAIADFTAKHYKQKAVMFYLVSNKVFIVHYD